MSVSDNNMSGSSHDPEQIDLIDLLVQLWRGKVTIVIAIVVAIVLAVGYLAVAKEKMDLNSHYYSTGCGSDSHL